MIATASATRANRQRGYRQYRCADQQQIAGKHPARDFKFPYVSAFDHADLKHPWQQQTRRGRDHSLPEQRKVIWRRTRKQRRVPV